jgi:four helix bundle protein
MVNEESRRANPVREKSYAFALEVVALCEEARGKKHGVLLRQLLRSGTSIGANVEEAIAGQSHRDFAAKMAIAPKEARECSYWLRLLRDSNSISASRASQLNVACRGAHPPTHRHRENRAAVQVLEFTIQHSTLNIHHCSCSPPAGTGLRSGRAPSRMIPARVRDRSPGARPTTPPPRGIRI